METGVEKKYKLNRGPYQGDLYFVGVVDLNNSLKSIQILFEDESEERIFLIRILLPEEEDTESIKFVFLKSIICAIILVKIILMRI